MSVTPAFKPIEESPLYKSFLSFVVAAKKCASADLKQQEIDSIANLAVKHFEEYRTSGHYIDAKLSAEQGMRLFQETVKEQGYDPRLYFPFLAILHCQIGLQTSAKEGS